MSLLHPWYGVCTKCWQHFMSLTHDGMVRKLGRHDARHHPKVVP